MNKRKKAVKLLWILLAIGINVLGKRLALALGLPLWLDAVGTIWAGMMAGPWIALTVGILTNVIASVSDYVTAFYAMVNVAVGIASGIFFFRKTFSFRQLLAGALMIAGISGILCVPMNLVFYNGHTGNAVGDLIYGRLAAAGTGEAVCAVLAEMLLELPDKLVAAMAAYGLYRALEGGKEETGGRCGIFSVLPDYRRMLIGTVIAYSVLVMMLIEVYILRANSSIPISMSVVFVYLCIASAVIVITIRLLNRRLEEEREKYENELTIRNEQLQAALESAESANKAKTSFLYNMSHDIRTPMNAIIGFTNMAERRIDDREKVLDCLSKTRRSGDMLLTLINSVLEVSRIESGRATLEEDPEDVRAVFPEIESTMLELAETKKVALSFETGPVKDPLVYLDRARCMRILVNVISNAVKYTPEGGRVRASCEQVGEAENGVGRYRFVIEDNGIGMSEEFRRHVFEQFSRENDAVVSGVQGTGLGMAVVKSFVDLMGGSIECRSEKGRGTTIDIVLPFRIRAEEERHPEEDAASVPAGGEDVSFMGKRVLLVEDNELNREIATDILEEEKLLVEEAENGARAVELLREKGPDYYDFVLMDIQMPVMDGYRATAEIRAMYPDAVLPIVALSANAFEEDREKSLAAGMNEHISKPIDVKKLFGTLRSLTVEG